MTEWDEEKLKEELVRLIMADRFEEAYALLRAYLYNDFNLFGG